MTSERYSERPFPPYAYRPGHGPHPLRSPDGHLFGRERAPIAYSPADPARSADHLFAVDLHNHGYFWEAHEVWEGLWHHLGRSGPAAALLQALIQCAAAHIKRAEGREDGVRLLFEKAEGRFLAARAAADLRGVLWGVAIDDYIERSRRYFFEASSGARPFPRITLIFDP